MGAFRARGGRGSSGISTCSDRRWSERRLANAFPPAQLLRQPEIRLDELAGRRERVAGHRSAASAAIDLASVGDRGQVRRLSAAPGERESSGRGETNGGGSRRTFPSIASPGCRARSSSGCTQVRPDTLGHALRIPGVTPAAVAVLAAYVGRFGGAGHAVSDLRPPERRRASDRASRALRSTSDRLHQLESYSDLLARWNAAHQPDGAAARRHFPTRRSIGCIVEPLIVGVRLARGDRR